MRKKRSNNLKLLIPVSALAVLVFTLLMKGPTVSGSPLFLGDWNIYLPLVLNNYVSPPPASVSRYMVTPLALSDFYNEGRLEAQAARGNVVVVLDFGKTAYQSSSYGAMAWPSPGVFINISNISSYVKNFAWGYWDYGQFLPAPNHLDLAVGISNQGSYVTSGHGQAWGQMVKG